MVTISACTSERVYKKILLVDGEEIEYRIRYFQGVSKDDVVAVIHELENSGKIKGVIYSIYKFDEKFVVQFVDDLSLLLTANPDGLSGQEVRLYKDGSSWIVEDSRTWIQ